MSESLPRTLKDACRNPCFAEALSQLVEKTPKEDVIDDLISGGIPRADAAMIAGRLAKLLDDTGKEVGSLAMLGGAVFSLIGLIGLVGNIGNILKQLSACVPLTVGLILVARGFRLRRTRMRGHMRERVEHWRRESAFEKFKPADETKRNPKNDRRYDY